MPSFRVSLTKATLSALQDMLKKAERRGDLRTVKRIHAIVSVIEGYSYSVIASILKVREESIRLWFRAFPVNGPAGFKSNKSSGTPPKLTKTQRAELDEMITTWVSHIRRPDLSWPQRPRKT